MTTVQGFCLACYANEFQVGLSSSSARYQALKDFRFEAVSEDVS